MASRLEKNKKYQKQINKEKNKVISKKIIKVLLFLVIIILIFVFYIYFIGIRFINTKEYVIESNLIPESFHGFKIVHFSDLLYGNCIDKDNLNDINEEIELLNPDIVIFTGDIVGDDYKLQEEEINILIDFFKNIPCRIGKYAVKGERDNSTFDLIMNEGNFIVLENEVISIYNGTIEKIDLVGLNINSYQEVSTSNDFSIGLIHNYDLYDKYNINTNITLAGHNLGGEIRFFDKPLLGNSIYNNDRYDNVYISSGLGSPNHVRLMNHPSINVYRLYSKV